MPIAHWLIGELKPSRVVELGTHYGVSFFAFCEAAKILSPNTFVYAIDTWEGDEHAGQYTEDVFMKVVEHWRKYHRTRASLLRLRFDDAAVYFEPGTIDVLHIDGLHTYEAVRNDFYTWLPMLNKDSVVLFHDTNERGYNFGVWKLWSELKCSTDYKAFELPNGHGLGVLILGEKFQYLESSINSVLSQLVSKGDLLEKLAELSPDGNFSKLSFGVELEDAKSEIMVARSEASEAVLNVTRARAEADKAKQEAMQAQANVEISMATIRELENKYFNIINSRSWKVTEPARKVAFFFRLARKLCF